MATLKSVLLVALVCYVGLVAVMYVAQRALMYFPYAIRTAPADADFPQAKEVELKAADGVRILAWTVPPQSGKTGGAVFPRQWRLDRASGGALSQARR